MRLVGSETNFKWFLRTVYYLRKYPIEEDFERTLAINIGWARTNIWRVMQKIQYLKYKKITWARRRRYMDLGSRWHTRVVVRAWSCRIFSR
jgi:hypothetical protein